MAGVLVSAPRKNDSLSRQAIVLLGAYDERHSRFDCLLLDRREVHGKQVSARRRFSRGSS